MKIRKRNGEIVEVADTYTLQDGDVLTTPLEMMDSARTMITDAHGQPAGQRPGFLYANSDVAHAVRVTGYAQYDEAISQRWRSDRWQDQPSVGKSTMPRSSFGTGDVASAYAKYNNDISNRWRR